MKIVVIIISVIISLLFIYPFVIAESLTLTDSNPSVNTVFEGVTYSVNLIAASDNAATIKASSSKEVSEKASKKIGGIEVKLYDAQEINLALSAILSIGDSTEISLNNDISKKEVTVKGISYTVELISVSDTATTLKVIDKNGKSESGEIMEKSSKKINGLLLTNIESDEENLKLSTTFVVGDAFILTDKNPAKEIKVGEEMYTAELISTSNSAATFRVSQSKEISEGTTKTVAGLPIKIIEADEDNLKLMVKLLVGDLAIYPSLQEDASDSSQSVEEASVKEIIEIEEIEEKEVESKINENEEENCDGCIFEDKCYPFGFRKGKDYCSDKEGTFVLQLEVDSSCENNFECSSNICVSGTCISEGLLQRILNWFRRLFGTE